MGLAVNDINCPQCSYPGAISDTYHKTKEARISCFRCGYNYKRVALIDRIKQKKDPDHYEWYKLNKVGEKIYREYTYYGYGVMAAFGKNGSIIILERPTTREEMIINWAKMVMINDIIIEMSYVTIADPESGMVEFIIGEKESIR